MPPSDRPAPGSAPGRPARHIPHDEAAGTPLWRWDGEAAATDGPLDDEVTADACVVGLGGTGLAAVEAFLAHGLDVVGVDAGPVAGAAAGRNGGLLLAGMAAFHHDAVARHGRERALAWQRATMAERDRLVAADPDVADVTGSLRVAADAAEAADLDAMAAAMRADDLPVEHVDHELGPALRFPGDAACNPWLRCQRLAARVRADGARLFVDSPATGVMPGRVATAGGEVRARHVMVAVDGGLTRVVPGLAGRVRPVRLQMLGTAPTSRSIPSPVYRRWGYDYWQQLADGRVALGGGRDRGGAAEDTDEPRPGGAPQAWLDQLAATVAPDAAVTHRWAAIVGWTDDGLPVCEQVADGVWALGGYCGTGNVVGPLLARLVAATCATGRPADLLPALLG